MFFPLSCFVLLQHGRLKVRTTAEQQEAKRKEREKKLKIYKGATAKAFQKVWNITSPIHCILVSTTYTPIVLYKLKVTTLLLWSCYLPLTVNIKVALPYNTASGLTILPILLLVASGWRTRCRSYKCDRRITGRKPRCWYLVEFQARSIQQLDKREVWISTYPHL